jgi:hypothetical protein
MSYARISTIIERGEISDYSGAQTNIHEDEWTSTGSWQIQETLAADQETVIDLALFTTIETLVIKNNATANYVLVAWSSADEATCSQRVPAGETLKLTDVLASGDIALTADTADASVLLTIIGA